MLYRLRQIKTICSGLLVAALLLPQAVYSEDTKVGNFTVGFEPFLSLTANQSVKISVTIEPANNISYVVLYSAQEGENKYRPVVLRKSGRTFSGTLPGERVTPPNLRYYLRLTNKKGVNTYVAGSPSKPIKATVQVPVEIQEAASQNSGFDLSALDSLESEFDMFAEEDVIVSAAKRRQRLAEAPSAVYVLTAEDIKTSGFTTIADVLRYAPGMNVYRINDGNALIGVRGFTDEGNNLVLVLLDGRQINVELFGSPFMDNIPVTLAEIERIEIVRGPGSTLYGANAFSGIINIITRDPLKDKKKARGMAAIDGISRTAIGDLYASGISNGIGYRVSARFRSAGAYSNKFVESVRQQAVRGVITTNKFGKLKLDVGLSQNTSEQYTVIGEVPVRMDRTHSRLDWSKDDFSASASWDFWRASMFPADGVLRQIIPELRLKTHTYDGEVRYTHFWDPWDQLTLGANVRLNTFRSDAVATPSTAETRAGLFVQNEFYPVDRMTINVGVRSDFSTFYLPNTSVVVDRFTFSPRISLVYAPVKNHTFRLNGGQAFRKPSYWEQKAELTGLSRFAANFANDDLLNEQILSLEGGYIFDGIEGFRLQLDGYYYQLRDLIDYDPGLGQFANSGNVNTWGSELAIRYRVNQHFSLFANYSLQQTIDLQSNALAKKDGDPCAASTFVQEQVGEANPATCKVNSEENPAHKAALGIRTYYGNWSVSLNGTWQSQRLWFILHPEKGNILFPFKQNQEISAFPVISTKAAYRVAGGPISVGLIGEQIQFDNHREFPGLDNITAVNTPGFPDRTSNYGGEKIGGKVFLFVEGEF